MTVDEIIESPYRPATAFITAVTPTEVFQPWYEQLSSVLVIMAGATVFTVFDVLFSSWHHESITAMARAVVFLHPL